MGDEAREEELVWEGIGSEEYKAVRERVESRLLKMGRVEGELPGWMGEAWRRTQRV